MRKNPLERQLTDHILDQLCAAIERDGRTIYRLSKDTGIHYHALWRLMDGTSVEPSFANVASIAINLGLSLDAMVASFTPERSERAEEKAVQW